MVCRAVVIVLLHLAAATDPPSALPTPAPSALPTATVTTDDYFHVDGDAAYACADDCEEDCQNFFDGECGTTCSEDEYALVLELCSGSYSDDDPGNVPAPPPCADDCEEDCKKVYDGECGTTCSEDEYALVLELCSGSYSDDDPGTHDDYPTGDDDCSCSTDDSAAPTATICILRNTTVCWGNLHSYVERTGLFGYIAQFSCPSTCNGNSCDYWTGNTCAELEDWFGCDCSGCSCENDGSGGDYYYDDDDGIDEPLSMPALADLRGHPRQREPLQRHRPRAPRPQTRTEQARARRPRRRRRPRPRLGRKRRRPRLLRE